jgi:hypothetical protein
VTFVDWDDLARWKMIDTALKLGLPEPLETYSSSAHLYELLDIPVGSTGNLKQARAPKVERIPAAKTATEKSAPKSSVERVKRERTRTKRITS